MSTLTRKGFARIYVDKAEDVEKVEAIVKELDSFEFDYLPDNLVVPFSEYPNLVYTGKFDGLCMTKLTAECWKRGIRMFVVDNGMNDCISTI